MIDYSFIRLKPTLSDALETNQSSFATLGYFNQVQLSTTGKYSQITNLDSGIAFDGNYAVFVCDCDGFELLDITNKVTIVEATDNKGVSQIQFTLENITKDFNSSPVTLKFKHTESDSVWFSNLITISDNLLHRTSIFHYKSYEEFEGIAYNIFEQYQSIRLKCGFVGNDSESQSGEYISINGLKLTSRLIETQFEKYYFDFVDNFTYVRLNKLLSHPVIYINDNRVTNKQTISSKEMLGGTNSMNLDFKVAVNYEDKYSIVSQIPRDFNDDDFDSDDFQT